MYRYTRRKEPDSMRDPITGATCGQRGFTLLEVLIALLVLAIGLLGLAGLHTTALRSVQMSFIRTQATLLAGDISDRMRANVPGLAAENRYYLIDTATAPVTSADCAVTRCSPRDMANFDLAAWRTAVGHLPGGKSRITRTIGAAPGVIAHTVTVHWNESRDPAVTGETCPPVDDSDLRCMQLTF